MKLLGASRQMPFSVVGLLTYKVYPANWESSKRNLSAFIFYAVMVTVMCELIVSTLFKKLSNISVLPLTILQGKLPARITVPLSVLNQPLKSKSVVTTPIVKGSLNTK